MSRPRPRSRFQTVGPPKTGEAGGGGGAGESATARNKCSSSYSTQSCTQARTTEPSDGCNSLLLENRCLDPTIPMPTNRDKSASRRAVNLLKCTVIGWRPAMCGADSCGSRASRTPRTLPKLRVRNQQNHHWRCHRGQGGKGQGDVRCNTPPHTTRGTTGHHPQVRTFSA
jgi:hypothetical protein